MMKRIPIPMVAAILALAALAGCAGTYEPASSYAGSRDLAYADETAFYDALAPYGDWIRSDRYGLVWSPYDKLVDWRPYTDGEWIWTDYGWTWAADEDWGWATYHYGRWYDDPYDGWCWVPGGQWAPAWVAWREGGGWVGWAPMPPELVWQDGGWLNDNAWLNDNDWDHLPGVEHYWWSFCRERDLPGPGLHRRLAPRYRAVVLIDETRNITRYTFDNARVANRSLDVAVIRRATGRDIATRRIADLAAPPDRTGPDGRQLTRDTYRAFRPRLREPAADTTPPNVRPSRPSPTRADQIIRTPQEPRKPQDAEARALQQRENAARERMQRDQRREDRQVPDDGVEAEKLRRQHEEEQKALADQAERDQRVLRSRQENSPPDPKDARKRGEPPVKSNRRGG